MSAPTGRWQVIVRCGCCGLRVPVYVEPVPDALALASRFDDEVTPTVRDPSGRVPRGTFRDRESAIVFEAARQSKVGLLVWLKALCPRCYPAPRKPTPLAKPGD